MRLGGRSLRQRGAWNPARSCWPWAFPRSRSLVSSLRSDPSAGTTTPRRGGSRCHRSRVSAAGQIAGRPDHASPRLRCRAEWTHRWRPPYCWRATAAVVGVTMKLWGGPSDTGCCSVADVDDARRVAQQLGIDHYVFNFSTSLRPAGGSSPTWPSTPPGGTPNPASKCNRHLKFDRLRRGPRRSASMRWPPDHHARIVAEKGREVVPASRARCRDKDQSYVLHMPRPGPTGPDPSSGRRIDQGQRSATSPPGSALRTAAKPDSQDVCFISRAPAAVRPSWEAGSACDLAGSSTERVRSSAPSRPSSLRDDRPAEGPGSPAAVSGATSADGGGPRYVVDASTCPAPA